MHLRSPLLSLLLLTTASACGQHGITNQPASLSASSSIWLRNTYDTDPSIYVGRFVPPGVTELDESNTMVLACSKHITTRFIDGGGVEYAEEMQVSTEVALKLGMPVVADGSAGYEHRRTARASYTLTGKLVAEISDPEAFAACCKAQPDQCTDRYIGEFIQGTGKLEHQAERGVNLEGQGTNPSNGLRGEGGVSRNAEWQRSAEFAEPVYFAFKVSPTPYTQAAVDTCPSWAEQPPSADDGVYVVGSAENARSESDARATALQNAGRLAAQSAGLSVPVRPDSWCVTSEQVNRRGKMRYAARVLAFVSDAETANAREQARIAAEQKAARKQAMLEAATEQARLEQARLEQGGSGGADQPDLDDPDFDEPGFDEPGFDEPGIDEPGNFGSGGGGTSSPVGHDRLAGRPDIDRILAAVEAETFSSDKLSALRSSSKDARVTAAEARRVVDAFTASDDKLEALRVLRDHVEDPQNWDVLVDGFTFSSDRDAARELAP